MRSNLFADRQPQARCGFILFTFRVQFSLEMAMFRDSVEGIFSRGVVSGRGYVMKVPIFLLALSARGFPAGSLR